MYATVSELVTTVPRSRLDKFRGILCIAAIAAIHTLAEAKTAKHAPAAPPRAVARLGFLKVSPGAQILIRNRAGKTRAGKAGNLVLLGETVESVGSARASLKLAGGTEVILGADARAQIDRAAPDTRVRVLRGQVLVRSATKRAPGSSVEAATFNAHAVAEGTLFAICFDDSSQQTFVESEKGRVQLFSAGGSALAVPPGERARIVRKGVPQKTTLKFPPKCRR